MVSPGQSVFENVPPDLHLLVGKAHSYSMPLETSKSSVVNMSMHFIAMALASRRSFPTCSSSYPSMAMPQTFPF